MVGVSQPTVIDWYNMCREVCSHVIHTGRQLMVGTADQPIQIDESRFAGKRKNNAGRLLAGDRPPQVRDEEVFVALGVWTQTWTRSSVLLG